LNDWLGVDLGGTWLRWGGASSGRLRLEDRSPEAILDHLITVSEGRGVAVSFAGWLCPEGRRVMQGPNLGWVDVPFVEMAAARGLNCHLENDLDARAWGEYMALETREPRSLIALNAGSGFALGLVVQGQLVRGFHHRAGEVGHLVLGPADRRCGCGDLGCAETLLGGAQNAPDRFDDPSQRQAWLDLAARIVAPVVAALDPHHVVGVGGILAHRPDLLRDLEQEIKGLLPRRWFDDFSLRVSVGESLALAGVVDLARHSEALRNGN